MTSRTSAAVGASAFSRWMSLPNLAPSPGRPWRPRARLRIGALAISLAVALIAASPAFADAVEFDGRLPTGSGERLDPEDADLPQAAREFLSAQSENFTVFWDHVLGTPRYLATKRPVLVAATSAKPISDTFADLDRGFRELVDRHVLFFGIKSSALDRPRTRRVGGKHLLLYRQLSWDVPIRGANVKVLIDEKGNLISMKAFVTRNEPLLPPVFTAPDAIVERLQAERGLLVHTREWQYVYSKPGDLVPVPIWRFVVETADHDTGEVFADAASGELIEERRFVWEAGVMEGFIRGFVPPLGPTPESGLFVTPENLDLRPIPNVMVQSTVDIGTSDAFGEFSVFVADDIADIEWHLRSGRCLEENELRIGQNDVKVCEIGELRLEDVLALNITMRSGDANCGSEPAYGQRLQSLPRNEFLAFSFNEERSQIKGGSVLAFHHMNMFHDVVTGEIHEFIDPSVEVKALNVNILNQLDISGNRIVYIPNDRFPRICMSSRFTERGFEPGDPSQPLVPTIINHEFAHHAIFSINGAVRSVSYDCFNFQAAPLGNNLPRCIEEIDERDAEGLALSVDTSMVEGATDALAAFHQSLPKFGFIADGEIRGPMGYDIATGEGLTDRIRQHAAGVLWEIREHARAVAAGEHADRTAKARSKALLLKWVAANAGPDDTARNFDFGPVFAAELEALNAASGLELDASIAHALEKFGLQGRPALFRRGDANQDGDEDISDAVTILRHLFLAELDLRCFDALDVDDRGDVNITDAIVLLGHLYLGQPQPPAPWEACGVDATSDDAVDCVRYRPCD